MFKFLQSVAALAAPLLAVATVAGATTYVGSGVVGGGSYALSVTTDGYVGILAPSDVTAFSVAVTDSAGTTVINQMNGELLFYDTGYTIEGVSATATDLYAGISDFPIGGNNILFQEGPIGGGGPFLCFQGNACFGTSYTYAQIGLNSQSSIGGGISGALPSNVTTPSSPFILIASTVPEPTGWAIMLVGLEIIGVTARVASASRLHRRGPDQASSLLIE